MGGGLFGYDMGAISGALPQLQAQFELNNAQSEWLVSILYLGGGLGAALGGTICDLWGRKTTILMTDVVFMIGAVWLYFASSYGSILAGRFVVGGGVAVSGVADVSYLHECAPPEWRGAVVSCNEACIALGFLLAYLAGYFYSDASKEEWRLIFGWAGVLAAVQLVGMLRLPESPAWLMERGKLVEARAAWREINGVINFEASVPLQTEMDMIKGEQDRAQRMDPTMVGQSNRKRGLRQRRSDDSIGYHEQQPSPRDENGSNTVIAEFSRTDYEATGDADRKNDDGARVGCMIGESYQHENDVSLDGKSSVSIPTSNRHSTSEEWKALKQRFLSVVSTMSRCRRQCFISLYLAVVQQFCGQTNVLNYSPLIFAEANKQDVEVNNNDTATASGWSTIAIGVVKFVVTVLVIWRIEAVGRRLLLLVGTSLIAVGLLFLVAAFGGSNQAAGEDYDGKSDGSNAVNGTWSPVSNFKTFQLALPGVLLVVTGYSMSFGPLTWLLTSELFPTDIRGRALGVSTIVTYLSAAIVTRTFLSAQAWMGPSKVFGIYFIITILGVIFEHLAIPDTGGKSVEQVEQALSEMFLWRRKGFDGEDHLLTRAPSALELGNSHPSQMSLSLHSVT